MYVYVSKIHLEINKVIKDDISQLSTIISSIISHLAKKERNEGNHLYIYSILNGVLILLFLLLLFIREQATCFVCFWINSFFVTCN